MSRVPRMTLNNELPLQCGLNHPISKGSYHYVYGDRNCVVVPNALTAEQVAEIRRQSAEDFERIAAHPEQRVFIADDVATEDAARSLDDLRDGLAGPDRD